MRKLIPVATLVVGLVLGWFAAGAMKGGVATPPVPSDWIGRVGDDYVSEAGFVEEMKRRGGMMPGQYHDVAQRRALLDDMLYQRALARAATEEGIADRPEVQRARDQILVGQYLQQKLRAEQEKITVSDADVRAYHEAHAAQFELPARRRVAIIRIPVAPEAEAAAWQHAEERAAEALKKARSLDITVPHFGAVAREYSEDQASRYRGGVIGWIADGQRERYRHDPAVLDAAYALDSAGAYAAPVRGRDGVYLVRLVELQPKRSRAFDELASGIRQLLVRERQEKAGTAFRSELLKRYGAEVREQALAQLAPLSAPADSQVQEPPAMPVDEG
jgi:parvulin-like peptidyl-prolyl isomerase